MIWERESGLDSVSMDVMMFASDRSYKPTDSDYESAKAQVAVEPKDRLPTAWGSLKLSILNGPFAK